VRTNLLGIDTAARVQELEARLQTQVEEASKMGSSLQLQLDDAVRERDMWKVASYAYCDAPAVIRVPWSRMTPRGASLSAVDEFTESVTFTRTRVWACDRDRQQKGNKRC
jgi:hypothetical protein